MRPPRSSWGLLPFLALGALPVGVLGSDVISTDGFTTCIGNPSIEVTAMDVTYNRATQDVVFNIAGSSSEEQNVTAKIMISAYGKQVYSKVFDPCDDDTYIARLCPVPIGTFSTSGSEVIPDSFASMIPSIAFSVPDLDGIAQMELISNTDKTDLACIQSTVSNGKSMDTTAVKYVAAGIAASALAVSAVGGFMGGVHTGGSVSLSPSFGEVVGWYHGMATNGMLSVKYPKIYQSFARNFGFSTGLIPWADMQNAIDNFRQGTGGNLTEDSYAYLEKATLVYSDGSNSSSSSTKRSLGRVAHNAFLQLRDVTTHVNDTTSTVATSGSNSTSNGTVAAVEHYVSGVESYVEQLMIPQANTFMTVLLIFAIVLAAITVGILLFKVALEGFAMINKLPKSFESFRKRYWLRLAKTITNLILLLYGSWTLYCVYQFTNGDSWAAKLLAAISWTLFTAVLLFFTIKIVLKVRQYQKMQGDHSELYDNKETWIKYSLFYDNFKKSYWWLFIPSIVYMFARNAVIAAFNGHGMAQTIGQGIVELAMLGLLVWSRPYARKSSNVINIVIQTVRVLSVICVFVFVEELGISQTTRTVTGMVLIVVQTVLTVVLAILIAVNAIVACIRMNPHRKARKEAEKAQNRDLDDLTPLDARNSLLMEHALTEYKGANAKEERVSSEYPVDSKGYDAVPPYEDKRRPNLPMLDTDETKKGFRSSIARMSLNRDSLRSPTSKRPGIELRSYQKL